MSMKRLALVSSIAASGLLLLRCSSTAEHPPLAQSNADGGGSVPEAGAYDALAYIDAGPPGMTLSRDAIDFGSVGCGKRAVVAFDVSNAGKYPFDWSARLVNALPGVFDVTPASGTLQPRESVTVSVTVTVPTDKGIVGLDGVLALASTFNGTPYDVSLPVKVVPRGAILRFGTASLDFGKIPIGQTPSQKFTLANDGNASAQVNLILADDPTAPFQRAPSGPVVVPPSASADVVETFSPSSARTWTTGVKLEPAGADDTFCAPIPEKGAFVLKGEGTTGSVTVLPASLSFGSVDPANLDRVDCGQAGVTQTATITNAGSTPLTWRAQLTAGSSRYNLSATAGTLQGGASQAIKVTPVPIPSVSSTEPDLYKGTLSITTDAVNDVQHDILLHQTARGAIISSAVAGAISFGSVRIGQPKSIDSAISNDGNVPAAVTLTDSNGAFPISFPGTSGSTVTIAPSQSVSAHFTFSPTAVQPYADTAKFTVPASVVRCDALPDDIALIGTGISGVSILPSNLNFGSVGCGRPAAAPQQLTLTNSGPAMSWTPTFTKGPNSPYTLTDAQGTAIALGSSRPLAQGASVTFNVVPKAIVAPATTAANGFGDSLTITTTSPGDDVHTIPLTETAQGAILTYAPVSIASTDGQLDHVTFQNFSLSNTGNYPVGYTISVTTESASTNAPNFVINLPAPNSPQQLTGGATQQGVLSTRSSASLVSGKPAQVLGHITIAPATDSLLCSDPPPILPLSSN